MAQELSQPPLDEQPRVPAAAAEPSEDAVASAGPSSPAPPSPPGGERPASRAAPSADAGSDSPNPHPKDETVDLASQIANAPVKQEELSGALGPRARDEPAAGQEGTQDDKSGDTNRGSSPVAIGVPFGLKRKRGRPSANDGNDTEVIRAGTIRRIMKLDKDVKMTAAEAVFLVSKATEHFVASLIEKTIEKAKSEDRKLIKYQDLAACAKENPQMAFLCDLLPDIAEIVHMLK